MKNKTLLKKILELSIQVSETKTADIKFDYSGGLNFLIIYYYPKGYLKGGDNIDVDSNIIPLNRETTKRRLLEIIEKLENLN